MESRAPVNLKLIPIVVMALVSMILITSQSDSAFAGVSDNDFDGYPSEYTCGGVNCDPDDNDPCNPDPDTQACFELFFELAEDVQDIVAVINDLVADGDLDLNNGQVNAITTKLEQAADKIATENINAAINQLNAFINQINAHINSGKISSLDGQPLILAAQEIITTLELIS